MAADALDIQTRRFEGRIESHGEIFNKTEITAALLRGHNTDFSRRDFGQNLHREATQLLAMKSRQAIRSPSPSKIGIDRTPRGITR
ncbi:MAG TPA: hypothetical protein VLA17_15425 [Candidatus Limnocylindria bacterium]|nr:hypothetical protein [Candidatus Limnocylindria bacterium]